MNFNTFQKIGIATIVAVYLLIWVGGWVRSTGSGMGCPDWPRCFGRWIPPTDAKELPTNYKEVYSEKRKEKNEKLARYLDFIGWYELGTKIRGDKNTYIEADFNATKTWIEYINRVIGVLIGFLILLTGFFSLRYWKKDKIITILSLFSVVLVLFQGWIGSVVVSTNLLQGLITFHMSLAILQIFVLLVVVVRSFYLEKKIASYQNIAWLNIVLIISIIFTFVQIVLGTQVREVLDVIAKKMGESARGSWVENIGVQFYIHRSFSWVILGSHILLVYLSRNRLVGIQKIIISNVLLILLILEFFTGVGLAYAGFPAVLQPFHLLLAVIIIGIQFIFLLLLNPKLFFKGNLDIKI